MTTATIDQHLMLIEVARYISPNATPEVLDKAADILANKGGMEWLEKLGAFEGQMSVVYAVQTAEKLTKWTLPVNTDGHPGTCSEVHPGHSHFGRGCA